MKLNFNTYRDKVYACWLGKNIGGTMGTPYEGRREMLDIQGFATAEGVILPNDDLDLQLVWLMAVERLGIRAIDERILGEFWQSYIGPNWNEYGIGKINMSAGLLPPLSGDAYNDWNNSNGAWIRTEIWACLAPACPDIAMKLAFQDACVDHGTREGTYAAVFVAAIESAAFVIRDLRRLISLALTKIPASSRMAQSIHKILECYDSGMDYREAREVIRLMNADIGNGWFEAPSNVTYAVLGLLYGEGDFKKSMIYAINCGDDTDCTAATVGSILGIMNGTAGIPADWRAHIGDGIVTVSIKKGQTFPPYFPENCTELTTRVTKIAPSVPIVFRKSVEFTDGADEVSEQELEDMFAPEKDKLSGYFFAWDDSHTAELMARRPYSFTVDAAFLTTTVSFDGNPDIRPMETKKVHLRLKNNVYDFGDIPYNLTLRWLGCEGWHIECPAFVRLLNFTTHSDAITELDLTITAPERVEAKNRLVLEIAAEGRPTVAYIPITLLGK